MQVQDSFYQAYYARYHGQHLWNWIRREDLVFDDPYQIYYPETPGVWNTRRNIALSLMGSHINIIWRGNKERNYEQQMKYFFDQLKERSVVIITNHITFGNFPVIIIELRKWAKRLWVSNDFDINTILGPALTTNRQVDSIKTISNLLKTVPATGNWTIPWHKQECSAIRENFKTAFFGMAAQPGHVFLMAPTGTRDYTAFTDDWSIKCVYFEGDASIRHTTLMLNAIVKEWIWLCMMWVNESNIKKWRDKDWKTILTRDNNWWFGDVMLWMEYIDPAEAKWLLKKRQFMDRLAQNISDRNWNQIAQTCTSNELSAFKSWDTLAPGVLIDRDHGSPYVEWKLLTSICNRTWRKIFDTLK